MILTPEERRALLGLLALLVLGQGAALLRDEHRARPDRELSAWLTRAQAARAESLGAVSDVPGIRPGAAAGLASEAGSGSLSGMPPDGKQIVTQRVDETDEGSFDEPAVRSGPAGPRADALEPVPIETVASIPAGVAATGRVAINRASARDLEALPGIGPSLARRIVEERERAGPFRSPSDLLRVKGIGPKKQAAVQGRIDWSL